MTDPKHIGPMAQDVMRRFPDKVFEGADGFLRIKLDDLPPGVTAFDLYQPVPAASYSAAMERWQKVFAHWDSKKGQSCQQ
jgi:hypothetical protein